MQTQLTIYFDASCSLCRSEMLAIKLHDAAHQLSLVDCSSADFDDTPFRVEGITREAMMERLHVRNNEGEWIIGVSAFELLYRTIGLNMLANLWGSRYTRPATECLYPWVARHRQAFSRTGIPVLFRLWGKYTARRANQRSRLCRDGQCSL